MDPALAPLLGGLLVLVGAALSGVPLWLLLAARGRVAALEAADLRRQLRGEKKARGAAWKASTEVVAGARRRARAAGMDPKHARRLLRDGGDNAADSSSGKAGADDSGSGGVGRSQRPSVRRVRPRGTGNHKRVVPRPDEGYDIDSGGA